MPDEEAYIRSLPNVVFKDGYLGLIFSKGTYYDGDEWFLWAEPELLSTLKEARDWKAHMEKDLITDRYNLFCCVIYSLSVVPPKEGEGE